MKIRAIGAPLAARAAALLLVSALLAGCGGNAGQLLPSNSGGFSALRRAQGDTPAGRRDIRTLVRIRIPHRTRSRRPGAHPSTISPLTQSLSIAVNTKAPVVFNTTPTSPGCTTGSTGTTCTFAVKAPPGTDTFTVITYSGASGGGTALDRGIVTVPIARGKANQVAITLGPVVTTTADSGMGSLRYAIGSANQGDTIMFVLPAGSTIALATPITINGNVNIAGPGASSVTISGGSTHQLFLIGGTATISGLTLTGGNASGSSPGGAIFNLGTVTLANDVIGNSTSSVALRRSRRSRRLPAIIAHRMHPHCTSTTAEGGALYNDGVAVISGTTFSGNVIQTVLGCVTAEGGAIFNDTFGSLSSTGDTYSNNAAAEGGAVYNASLGLASFTGDTFNANLGCTAASGCPTSGCTATACSSSALGVGAAIYDNGLGITVINSTFTNNVAGGATPASVGEGGAIFLGASSALPTITGSTFTGNVAGGGTTSCSNGDGGAIFATNSIEIDNDTFKNNSATGDHAGVGGAVVGAVNVTGTGDTFTGNTSVGSGGACTASGQGAGAVFTGGSVTFNNSTFSNNTASGNSIGAGAAITANSNVTVNNSTFSSNTATSTGAGGATSNIAEGGAILSTAIVKVSGSTFSSNAVSLTGASPSGAIGGAIAGQTAVISTNDTYTSNTATQTTGSSGTTAGGALGVLSGTWVSNGDKFTTNSASGTNIAGGGGVLANGSGCIVGNSTFTSNGVTGPEGAGGAFAISATCHVTNATITGNTATSSNNTMGVAGGIYDGGGATILDSTISGNTASNGGGGIFAITHPEIVENSSITGNTVNSAALPNAGGGGISENGGLELNNVTIANNTVTVSGGGPAGGGGILDSNGILMLATTISGNKVLGTASASGGGGVYTSGTSVIGINITIGDNSSSEDGGGIELAGSASVSLGNSTIYSNSATGNGGNVNVGSSAALTLVNSILAGGTASGTGMDANNAGSFTSSGNNIVGTNFPGYTPASGDLANTNPQLLSLTNNGGPTFTFADQAPGVSPGAQHITYSGGNCGTVTIAADQRGFTRGSGGKCDVGAYEYGGVASAARRRPAAMPKRNFRHTSAGMRSPMLRLHLKPLNFTLPM